MDTASIRKIIFGCVAGLSICCTLNAQTVPKIVHVEAERFVESDTFSNVNNNELYFCIRGLEDSAWIRYTVDFGTRGTIDSLVLYARTKELHTGVTGTLIFQLDSLGGPVIAANDIVKDSVRDKDWKYYRVSIADSVDLRGKHQVYIRYRTDRTNLTHLFNLDWFSFRGEIESPGPREYYVSSRNGNDNYPGTVDKPFNTIAHASRIMIPGDKCHIRAGMYFNELSPRHNGTSGNPIIYEGYADEKAVICAGKPLENAQWEEYGRGIYRTAIELDSIGPGSHLLFSGTKALPEARWPKLSMEYTPKPSNDASQGDAPVSCEIIPPYDASRTVSRPILGNMTTGDCLRKSEQNLCVLKQVYVPDKSLTGKGSDAFAGGVLWKRGNYWAESGLICASEDEGDKLLLTLKMHRWRQHHIHVRGYITGVPALITEENEWAVQDGFIYVKPPAGSHPEEMNLWIKNRFRSINLYQRQHIEIRDLHFLGGAPVLIGTHGCMLENCHFRHPSKHLYILWREYSDDCPWKYQESRTDRSGFNSMIIGGSNNVVRRCSFVHSSSGIMVEGTRNLVEDCLFKGCNYSSAEGSAVVVGGYKNIVSQCTIDGTTRAGITFTVHRDGGHHGLIEYCDIKNTCTASIDGAASYIYNKAAYTGEISHCWYRKCYIGYSGAYIYLDHAPSDLQLYVHHNVFFPHDYESQSQAKFVPCMLGGGIKFLHNTVLTQTNPDEGQDPWGEIIQRRAADSNYIEKGRIIKNNIDASVNIDQWHFVDTSANDFRLQQSSPAIDSGEVVSGYSESYRGNAPDLGAYEYGRPRWVPGITWGSYDFPSSISTSNFLQHNRSGSNTGQPFFNVTEAHITITLSDKQDARIALFDMQGRRLASVSRSNMKRHVLDLSRYAAGIYCVRVITARNVHSRKFVSTCE